MRKYADLTIYRRLLQQARPHLLHIGGYGVLECLTGLFTLLVPLPLKLAIDHVVLASPLPHWVDRLLPGSFSPGSIALLLFAVGLLIVIRLADLGHSLLTSLVRTYAAEKLVLDFRGKLFGHAQRLSLAYHDVNGAIDSTHRIQNDAPAIQYILIDGIIPFISALLTVAAMFWVMVWIDWQFALVALAVSPVFLFSTRFFRRQLRQQSRELKAVDSSAVSVIQEVLGGLRVVKAFGQEDRERDRYVRTAGQSLRLKAKLMITESAFSMIIGLTTALGTAAALFIGVRHVQAGIIELGTLIMLMAYLTQLQSPLRAIGQKIASLQGQFASMERAFSLLDTSADVPERAGALALARAHGEFAFEDVCFSYDGRRDVLRNVSFHVPAGARVGIAGTTGSGKTTQVNLITRFYDPTAGRITLDGVDLRDYKLADLRRQFAIVLQEPLLFSTSIMENIAYSRPDATEEQIIAAAKAAHADEFINRQPEKYQTRVGERGMSLSGGERQRISLARAFLRDAPILILDEPTSSVDMRTEALIVEAMERLMKGRTTYIIAHRLSTLRFCDMLLVMEHGQLRRDLPELPAAIEQLSAQAMAVGLQESH